MDGWRAVLIREAWRRPRTAATGVRKRSKGAQAVGKSEAVLHAPLSELAGPSLSQRSDFTRRLAQGDDPAVDRLPAVVTQHRIRAL